VIVDAVSKKQDILLVALFEKQKDGTMVLLEKVANQLGTRMKLT
jgi:hypothetical protein